MSEMTPADISKLVASLLSDGDAAAKPPSAVDSQPTVKQPLGKLDSIFGALSSSSDDDNDNDNDEQTIRLGVEAQKRLVDNENRAPVPTTARPLESRWALPARLAPTPLAVVRPTQSAAEPPAAAVNWTEVAGLDQLPSDDELDYIDFDALFPAYQPAPVADGQPGPSSAAASRSALRQPSSVRDDELVAIPCGFTSTKLNRIRRHVLAALGAIVFDSPQLPSYSADDADSAAHRPSPVATGAYRQSAAPLIIGREVDDDDDDDINNDHNRRIIDDDDDDQILNTADGDDDEESEFELVIDSPVARHSDDEEEDLLLPPTESDSSQTQASSQSFYASSTPVLSDEEDEHEAYQAQRSLKAELLRPLRKSQSLGLSLEAELSPTVRMKSLRKDADSQHRLSLTSSSDSSSSSQSSQPLPDSQSSLSKAARLSLADSLHKQAAPGRSTSFSRLVGSLASDDRSKERTKIMPSIAKAHFQAADAPLVASDQANKSARKPATSK